MMAQCVQRAVVCRWSAGLTSISGVCVCFAVSWFLNMGEFWDYLRHVLSRYFHTAQCTLDLDLDMWILIVQTSMILNMNILECSPVTMFKCV